MFLLFFVLVSSHQPFLFTLKVLQEVNLYRREVVLGTFLEFVVFLVGFLFGELGGYFACMSENVFSGDTEEVIKNVYPILHIHRAVFLGLHFGEVKIQAHDAVQ